MTTDPCEGRLERLATSDPLEHSLLMGELALRAAAPLLGSSAGRHVMGVADDLNDPAIDRLPDLGVSGQPASGASRLDLVLVVDRAAGAHHPLDHSLHVAALCRRRLIHPFAEPHLRRRVLAIGTATRLEPMQQVQLWGAQQQAAVDVQQPRADLREPHRLPEPA